MYVDGMNLRRTARHLEIHHRTVSLWIQVYTARIPEIPLSEEVKEVEMDELFTFIGHKKKPDLHYYPRRSAHALLFGLESGLGTHRQCRPRDGR